MHTLRCKSIYRTRQSLFFPAHVTDKSANKNIQDSNNEPKFVLLY